MSHVGAGAGAAAMVAALALYSATSQARRVSSCSPRLEQVATPGLRRAAPEDVAIAPDGDVWVVGENTAFSRPMIFRGQGNKFVQVPVPRDVSSDFFDSLRAVAVSSNHEAWAVGDDFSLNLVLHWDGRSWRHTPVPVPPASYWDVSASSPTDVWAVGTADRGGFLVIRWDGAKWRRIPSPRIPGAPPRGFFRFLKGVVAIGPSDVWVAGGPPPFLAHWDGAQWQTYPAPNGTFQVLSSVVALSPVDIWAAGDGAMLELNSGAWLVSTYGGYQNVIVEPITGREGEVWGIGGFADQLLRWDGSAWAPLERAPQGIALSSLATDSRGDVWAVGSRGNWRLAILHYHC